MSITATFYTFAKQKNSTKRPSGGHSFSIFLKDPCSVTNPTILLSTSTPVSYNYCYIPLFDRYYWVSDWVSDHNMWQASLSVDVLASWRDTIRSSSQYVLRSASEWDGYIIDPFYPGTLKKSYAEHNFATTEKCFDSANFTYIIGVVNGEPNVPRLGGVTYYALTGQQLQDLMNALLGDASYLGDNGTFPILFGITKEVMQALVNPMQYIVDSYMLPWSVPYTTPSDLKVGWYTLPGFGSNIATLQLTNQVYRNTFFTLDYTLPYHPQFTTRGAYMKGEPFTHITLYAGIFGEIQLDSTMLVYNDTAIHFSVTGDYTGCCELTVTGKQSGCVLAKRTADAKIPFKISQMYQDRLGMISNVMSQATGGVAAGAQLAMGNPSGMTGYAGTVLNSFEASMPKVSSSGMPGSLFEILKTWKIVFEFTECVDEDLAQRGRPLCQVKTLSTLSGFVTIADPELDISCYGSEYDEIISYMSGGFYLE